MKILISEVKQHGEDIDIINRKNAGNNVLPAINYVKLVRVFLKSDDYAEVETECLKFNDNKDGNYIKLLLHCLKYAKNKNVLDIV